MTDQLTVVSECCPVGCGYEVVVVQRRGTAELLGYCDACGCVFPTPEAAQFAAGLNEIRALADAAPGGISLPEQTDLAKSCFGAAVLRSIPASAWGASVLELNAAIEKELRDRDRAPG